jgi:uncharacterized repeat protein (TIGR01451 family)
VSHPLREKTQLFQLVDYVIHSRTRAAFAAVPAGLGRGAAGAVLLGLAVTGAAAQTTAARDGVIVSSALERVVATAATDGGLTLTLAVGTVASHTDQLIYSVRFSNASEHVADAVRVTSPVPADVKYVAGSASGPGSRTLFSVDHGRTFGQPEELVVVQADGVRRVADAADYTHVRWVLDAPLDAGATGIARFRAVPR